MAALPISHSNSTLLLDRGVLPNSVSASSSSAASSVESNIITNSSTSSSSSSSSTTTSEIKPLNVRLSPERRKMLAECMQKIRETDEFLKRTKPPEATQHSIVSTGAISQNKIPLVFESVEKELAGKLFISSTMGYATMLAMNQKASNELKLKAMNNLSKKQPWMDHIHCCFFDTQAKSSYMTELPQLVISVAEPPLGVKEDRAKDVQLMVLDPDVIDNQALPNLVNSIAAIDDRDIPEADKIKFISLNWLDSREIAQYLDSPDVENAYAAMDEAINKGKTVLVSCGEGVSFSGPFTAVYLASRSQQPYNVAWEHTMYGRPALYGRLSGKIQPVADWFSNNAHRFKYHD